MGNSASTKNLTPMLSQYLQIKGQHPDAILLYRMGDFYELFFEDATRAAPVLEVQLTSRDKNAEDPIPMCGVPHHAASLYVQKLLAHGFKVAICEQMEDPATAKGIVKREVTRILTPALVGDPDLVPEESSNELAALHENTDGHVDVCLFDLLSGKTRIGSGLSYRAVVDLSLKTMPKEFLVSNDVAEKKWFRELSKMFPAAVVTRRSAFFQANQKPPNGHAYHAVCQYLKETQKTDEISFLCSPQPIDSADVMALDATTLNSLEVVRGHAQNLENLSLLGVLDFTSTPMGKRTLREWLCRPLCNVKQIEERLSSVEAFVLEANLLENLKSVLSQIRDLERLAMKTALGLAMPRDLVAVREILKRVPEIQAILQGTRTHFLSLQSEQLNALAELTDHLERALEDFPPATFRDGKIFKESYDERIDQYRKLAYHAKNTIAEMESREREQTGIASLKIRFNKVFGYTIEVTKAHLSKVPPRFIRKQTLANAERYTTDELQEFEQKAITAESKLRSLEESMFLKLREEVARHTAPLLGNARILGTLDVLLGFAVAAKQRNYKRPEFHGGHSLVIREGRHAVVETILPPGDFVPNSIELSDDECRTLIITGPNMSGKSTIMRQVALILIMAQAGSFVPARCARIPVTDAIFTRIGSSDDLSRGRSTFMVEMTEVARILNSATTRSLILIDEIGRGTSTYDGLSLAWSLLEYVHETVRAKTLFATHFHEITALENHLPQLKNANVLVDRWNDEIVFLHRLSPGICNRSYGVEVARLAGLPSKVLSRAKEILGLLESHSQRGTRARSRALEIHDNQMAFFDTVEPPENRFRGQT